MRQSLSKRKRLLEKHNKGAALFRDFILGGQDGLVNVLGVILGMAVVTNDPRLVIIAGLSVALSDSVSMGAVAFTSSRAFMDYYKSQEKLEEKEIKTTPKIEKKEVYDIYYKNGFRGKLLDDIVKKITSNKTIWKNIMMKEELGLSKEFISPIKSAGVVFLATLIGAFIPLTAFFFMPIYSAIIYSLIFSAIALFITGALEAKLTIGNWISKGIQLMLIGMTVAIIGFIVGKIFGSG
jgi:VIT1/CCC1 family predicted Fe2+/Mn2+ transporter